MTVFIAEFVFSTRLPVLSVYQALAPGLSVLKWSSVSSDHRLGPGTLVKDVTEKIGHVGNIDNASKYRGHFIPVSLGKGPNN